MRFFWVRARCRREPARDLTSPSPPIWASGLRNTAHRASLYKCLVIDAPATVFLGRFAIMASLTQRLPVALTPEQLHISFVWLNVIHYRRSCCASIGKTSAAQWIIRKVYLARTLPPTVIAAFSRRSTPFIDVSAPLFFVVLTLPTGYKNHTSRVGAWTLRRNWHFALVCFAYPLASGLCH